MRALRRVKFWQWAQVHFKVAFGTWMFVLLYHTPALSANALGTVIYLVAAVVLAGTATAIVGLIMSAQGGNRAHRGLLIEMSGLSCMIVAPVVYFITQIVIASNTPGGWEQRGAFVVLLYTLAAAVFARACRVGRTLKMTARLGPVAE